MTIKQRNKIIDAIFRFAPTLLKIGVLTLPLWWPSGHFTTVLLSFYALIFVGLAVLSILTVFFKKKKWSAIFLIAALCYFVKIVPSLFGQGVPENVEAFETISVLQANVLVNNKNYEATVAAMLETNADLIAVQEVDRFWSKSLSDGLHAEYPFQANYPSDIFASGVAFFSKYPIVEERLLQSGNRNLQRLEINTPAGAVTVFNVHLSTPVLKRKYISRQRQFEELYTAVDKVSGRVLVLGDFNTVPWDPSMERFLERTRLESSRQGYVATYPTFLPLSFLPIDHILVDQEMGVRNFNSVQLPGSDHKGLKAEILIPRLSKTSLD